MLKNYLSRHCRFVQLPLGISCLVGPTEFRSGTRDFYNPTSIKQPVVV